MRSALSSSSLRDERSGSSSWKKDSWRAPSLSTRPSLILHHDADDHADGGKLEQDREQRVRVKTDVQRVPQQIKKCAGEHSRKVDNGCFAKGYMHEKSPLKTFLYFTTFIEFCQEGEAFCDGSKKTILKS